MPTSILLAVLAAAGLLALAPALVRRYDAGERIAAERAESKARVLSRDRRRRSVPGRVPLNPPRANHSAHPVPGFDDPPDEDPEPDEEPAVAGPAPARGSGGWARAGRVRAASVRLTADQGFSSATAVGESDVASYELRTWWQRRHRRILIGMLLLNFAELAGVILLGPGFWIGFGLSFVLLLWYVRYLRLRALASHRDRLALPASPVKTGPAHYLPRQASGPLTESADDPQWAESGHAEDRPAATTSTLGLTAPGTDSRWPAEPTTPDYDDEDDDPDPDDDPPPPPQRRRTGGIRGRSYESPAANV